MGATPRHRKPTRAAIARETLIESQVRVGARQFLETSDPRQDVSCSG